MAQAAERSHWYDQTGNPMYEVPRAKGDGMRPTTVRDARKLSLLPSVTTIMRIMAKPGLELWKQQNLMLAALTLTREPNEPDDAFIIRVMADSREQGRTAAKKGTELHSVLESAFKKGFYEAEYEPYVTGVQKALVDAYGNREWCAENSFASELGYGGKVDLYCLGDDPIVVDFKTKESIAKAKPFAEQAIQLAAYAHGLGIPDARLVNVYVSVTEPGEVKVHTWDNGSYFQQFELMLALWSLQKSYQPAFGGGV